MIEYVTSPLPFLAKCVVIFPVTMYNFTTGRLLHGSTHGSQVRIPTGFYLALGVPVPVQVSDLQRFQPTGTIPAGHRLPTGIFGS
jgi:hypothetical protein